MVRLHSSIAIALFALATLGQAQAPIILNTRLESFTPLTSTNYIADVWGYIDPQGREYALVCRGNSGLDIWEVTNGANPQFRSHIAATASDLKDCAVWLHYVYAVQQNGDTLIIDISNPSQAQVVNTIPNTGGHNAYCADGYLYYSRSGGGDGNRVGIYDLTDPVNPVFLSGFDPPSGHNSHDVHVLHDVMYDADIFSGFTRIVDITDRSNPVELGQTAIGNHSGWAYEVEGEGAIVYLSCDETAGGFLNSWDVSDPTAPVFLDSYVTDPTKSIHNVVVVGRYAYISYYVDGLRIVDLSNPADLREVGIYDIRPSNAGTALFDGSWGVYPLSETKVLLTEIDNAGPSTSGGFYVIEFTPPPRVELKLDRPGGALSIEVSADPLSRCYLGASLQVSSPFGTLPFLGMGSDALFTMLLPSAPFQMDCDATGRASFSVAAGLPTGVTLDLRAVGLAGAAFQTSELARITL